MGHIGLYVHLVQQGVHLGFLRVEGRAETRVRDRHGSDFIRPGQMKLPGSAVSRGRFRPTQHMLADAYTLRLGSVGKSR
jgi:hypothetical protein